MEKVNFKIRVCNPKESAEIQRVLFKLGFCWAYDIQKVLYTDEVCLFFEIDNKIPKGKISFSSTLDFFKKHESKEVTLKKLKSKEFQIYLKKLIILENLK